MTDSITQRQFKSTIGLIEKAQAHVDKLSSRTHELFVRQTACSDVHAERIYDAVCELNSARHSLEQACAQLQTYLFESES